MQRLPCRCLGIKLTCFLLCSWCVSQGWLAVVYIVYADVTPRRFRPGAWPGGTSWQMAYGRIWCVSPHFPFRHQNFPWLRTACGMAVSMAFYLCVEFKIVVALGQVQTVEASKQVDLFALLPVAEVRIAYVGHELVDLHIGGDDARGLMLCRKETVAP